MKFKDLRSITPAAAAALWATSLEAATHRVPSQYPTINNALDAAVAGDIVLVAPGTYTEPETRTISVGGSPFEQLECSS